MSLSFHKLFVVVLIQIPRDSPKKIPGAHSIPFDLLYAILAENLPTNLELIILIYRSAAPNTLDFRIGIE